MKKVAFMFVAAMAISFASCGGQTAANAEAADSTCCEAAEEIVEAGDSVVVEVLDSAAAVVEEVVAE